MTSSDPPQEKLNGSVERLAEAFRDVVTEAVEEAVDRKIDPIRQEVKQHSAILEQHSVLLRAMAHTILPKEVMAELDRDTARES